MRNSAPLTYLPLSVWVSFCSFAVATELPAEPFTRRALQARLEDAVEIGLGQRAGRMVRAVDPNERYEANFGVVFIQNLLKKRAFDTLFRVADEAFEAEFDKGGGATRGPQQAERVYQDDHSPPPLQPIHRGELGGLDGSSCRACHFSGGPDGSGSGSQLTLLRGDGETLSSATRRDPPHVMGLGYLSLVARDMQDAIDETRAKVLARAKSLNRAYSLPLKPIGIDLGSLSATPSGELDTSKVTGISSDLKVRPFGWKGRHADLVSLCEEALQVHHGLQSEHRIDAHISRPDHAVYLGEGSRYDPDGDGKQAELASGQGVAMAAYVSMLGAPVIKPPHSSRLALKWAQGRTLFESVGCAECHRTDLRFRWRPLPFNQGERRFEVDLKEGGQEPNLRTVDFSPTPSGTIPRGTALFAFTDLRRHDMGPELAEPTAERLPDGSGEVAGELWLTRPLWGLADTAPYLHDGRAQTVEEAILWHGGEGASAREGYKRLSEGERGALRMYLMSFTRASTLLVE